MKKIAKILSVVLCMVMVLGLVGVVSAAEESMNIYANKGTLSGKTITWTSTNFSFKAEQGSNTNAIRTSDTDHFRVYQGNKVTIAALNGLKMTKIVVTTSGSSYNTPLVNSVKTVSGATTSVNGTTVTITLANPAESISFSTTAQVRLKKIAVTLEEPSDCEHSYTDCDDTTCDKCGAERSAVPHAYDNCDDTSCNTCGKTREAVPHTYASEYVAKCAVCGATRTATALPEVNSTLTIVEANKVGVAFAHDKYTTGKYYVEGKIKSIANTTYGNLYIEDEQGNTLYVYGVYSADGKIRFDALTDKPAVGDTIKLWGVLGTYNDAVQMKSGWLVVETDDDGGDVTPPAGDDDDDNDDDVVVTPPAGGTGAIDGVTPTAGMSYKLGVWQNSLGEFYYFAGTVANKDYYMATTTDFAAATDVTVESVTGGYHLSFMDGTTKKYLDIYKSDNGYVNIRITEAPTAVFTWNATHKTFAANIDGEDYYMGTYTSYNDDGTIKGDYSTLSASKLSYLPSDSSYASHVYAEVPAKTGDISSVFVALLAVSAIGAGALISKKGKFVA